MTCRNSGLNIRSGLYIYYEMSSTASIDDLIALSRNRWTLPLLSDTAAHRGVRFVELLHRLELPRDSLARTLEAATLAGWIKSNPGHGHPLRPEYVLTEEGQRLAPIACAIQDAQNGLGLSPADMSRWSMPLVRAIDLGNHRFNALSRTLAPATPRALSQGLRDLVSARLVVRRLVDDYPPSSHYGLTQSGLILARAA